jgi:hypothetical protein
MLSRSPHSIPPFETTSPPEYGSFRKDIPQVTGLEVELCLTNNEIEGSLYYAKCTSASSPVTCEMSF